MDRKRAREEEGEPDGDEDSVVGPEPPLSWTAAYSSSRTMVAHSEAAAGHPCVLTLRTAPLTDADAAALRAGLALCGSKRASVTPAVPDGGGGSGGGGVAARYVLSHTVWLPPALSKAAVEVVFPGVGLGNRLFMYTVARLACALLGRRFALLTPHPLFAGVARAAAYALGDFEIAPPPPAAVDAGAAPGVIASSDATAFPQAASSPLAGWTVSTPLLPPSDERFVPPMPLTDALALQREVGARYVQALPSCGAAGSLLLGAAAPLVAAWLAPLTLRALTASLVAHGSDLGAAADEWVCHVRTGDTWVEGDAPEGGVELAAAAAPRSSSGSGSGNGLRPAREGRVNRAFCPPPVAWHERLSRERRMGRVLLVSASPASLLTRAVDAALRRGGASDVVAVSGSEEADFGALLRAPRLLLSCSTFAWWAAFLAPFATRTAVLVRTQAGMRARAAAAAAAGTGVGVEGSVPTAAAGGGADGASAASCTPTSGASSDGTPELQLEVPLTGMLRPDSVHAVHADLALPAAREPQRWWDATALAASPPASAAAAPPMFGAWSVSARQRAAPHRVWDAPRAAVLDEYDCSHQQRVWILAPAPADHGPASVAAS